MTNTLLTITNAVYLFDWSTVDLPSEERLTSVNVRVNIVFGFHGALYYRARVTPSSIENGYSYGWVPKGTNMKCGASNLKPFPTDFVDRLQQDYFATDVLMAAVRSSELADHIQTVLVPVVDIAARELQAQYPLSLESTQHRMEQLESHPKFLRLRAVVDNLAGWAPTQ